MSGPNYGISHYGSGNIVNNGIQALGPNAVAGGPNTTALIDELHRALLDHRSSLSAQHCLDAQVELRTIAEEVEAPAERREPGRIRSALAALSGAVGSVAVLATKAESLRQAVESLIH